MCAFPRQYRSSVFSELIFRTDSALSALSKSYCVQSFLVLYLQMFVPMAASPRPRHLSVFLIRDSATYLGLWVRTGSNTPVLSQCIFDEILLQISNYVMLAMQTEYDIASLYMVSFYCFVTKA